MKRLESKQNKFFKEFQKLKTKKGRAQSGSYIVDGLRIVKHAIEHDVDIECIVMSETFSTHGSLSDHPHYVVPDDHFKMLSETETPQGVLAVIQMEQKPLKEGKFLFLDEVQDPGNMGTLIRTADAAGFSGVVLKKGCTDPYSQKAIRSSMGSIMSIPILMNQDAAFLDAHTVYGAALEGGQPYTSYDYPDNCVLVIGNEGNGISGEILDRCNHRVYIPMIGDVESLNASIAGGILMFEMQKTCT
jgi:TrmH family RNA methyltransferase